MRPRAATICAKRIGSLPGFGDMKVRSLVATLVKQFGVKPDGWETVLPSHPTLGDVNSPEALAEYQAAKREHKRQVRAERERTNSTLQTPTDEVATTDEVVISGAGWGQKAVMLTITLIPFVGFVVAVGLLWNTAVGWTDLLLLVSLYLLCGFGITIGFHRMLTHSAFVAVRPLKAALLILGSMAVQGAAITWAVDHRTHHAHSDKEGDPHSPHHGFGGGVGGQLRGLVHAHVGWMFVHQHANERAAPGAATWSRTSWCASSTAPSSCGP